MLGAQKNRVAVKRTRPNDGPKIREEERPARNGSQFSGTSTGRRVTVRKLRARHIKPCPDRDAFVWRSGQIAATLLMKCIRLRTLATLPVDIAFTKPSTPPPRGLKSSHAGVAVDTGL